jgi:outer membrane receptor for monomeric catechols
MSCGAGLDLNASLTWTDSTIERNDKFPASVGKWQPRIPEWRATGVATYRVNDKLALTLAARYSGSQYSTLDNSDPNGFAYQGASKYFTADLRGHVSASTAMERGARDRQPEQLQILELPPLSAADLCG